MKNEYIVVLLAVGSLVSLLSAAAFMPMGMIPYALCLSVILGILLPIAASWPEYNWAYVRLWVRLTSKLPYVRVNKHQITIIL